jgi:hypothetical protein
MLRLAATQKQMATPSLVLNTHQRRNRMTTFLQALGTAALVACVLVGAIAYRNYLKYDNKQ